MGWLVATAGVIATLQAAAWLGGADGPRARIALGVAVGCAGIAATGLGLLHALLPSFFAS